MCTWYNCDVVQFFQRRGCILDEKREVSSFDLNLKLLQKHNIRILLFETNSYNSKYDSVLVIIFNEGITLKNTTYTFLKRCIFPRIFQHIDLNQSEICFLVDNCTSGVKQQIKQAFKRTTMFNSDEIKLIYTHNFHRSTFRYADIQDRSKLKYRLKHIRSSDIVCKKYGYHTGDIVYCEEFPMFMNCGICEYYIVIE